VERWLSDIDSVALERPFESSTPVPKIWGAFPLRAWSRGGTWGCVAQ